MKAIEFTPSRIDRESAHREIRGHAGRLAPEAVDEATGHVLDPWIDARAEQWLAEVEDEHGSYRVRAESKAGKAKADLSKLDRQRGQAERRLGELTAAREVTLKRMLGEPRTEEAGGGFADAALLAGRTRGSYWYLVALLFAVGADISAFFQVIQLVMPDQSETVALVLVLGFTAIVLALAHGAGALLRDRRAGVPWVPAIAAPLCVLIWVALGLLAAWVRLKFGALPVSSGDFSLDGSAQAESRDAYAFPAAATFLALYVGSGLITGAGAYLTHNRFQSAHGKAARTHDRAARHAATIADAYEQKQAELDAQNVALEIAEGTLCRQRRKRLALAEELKRDTRRLIAERKKDPVVTGAVSRPDLRVHYLREDDRPDRGDELPGKGA